MVLVKIIQLGFGQSSKKLTYLVGGVCVIHHCGVFSEPSFFQAVPEAGCVNKCLL
jgi:hypothetical protein